MTKPPGKAGFHLFQGATWIFAGQLLIFPAGFISAVFLTRVLGPDNYGLFTLSTQLIKWLEWIGVSILARATVKMAGESDDWQPLGRATFRMHLLIGFILAFLLWVFAPALASMVNAPPLERYMRMYSVDIPIFLAGAAHIRMLVGRRIFGGRALTGAARITARLVGILVLVGMGLSVEGAIAAMILASVVELFVARRFIRLPLDMGPAMNLKPLFQFATPLFAAALAMRVLRLDILLLKGLGTPNVEIGCYGAAMNLTLLVGIFSAAMMGPMLATISRLLADGMTGESHRIAQTILRASLWLLPLTVLAAACSEEIVMFIFGSKYLPAAPILSLLLFAAFFEHLMGFSTTLMTAMNRPKWVAGLTLPLLPAGLALHLFLIPRYGALGAATATLLVIVAGSLIALSIIWNQWMRASILRTLWRTLLVSLLIALPAVLIKAAGIWLVLKLTILGAMVPLLLWAIGELSGREINLIRSFLPGRQPDSTTAQEVPDRTEIP